MSRDDSADPVGQLAEDFVARYRRGERPSLTEYTEKHPDLTARIRKIFPMMVLMEQAASGDDSSHAEPPPEPEAMPALERIGGYRILREIGRGGMGIVYEAEQVALGRHVALKVLPLPTVRDSNRLERFQREARAAARLHHTNIVPVHEVGQDGARCYYAMQFIQGQPLDQVLRELRRLRVRELAVHVPEESSHGPPAQSLLLPESGNIPSPQAASELDTPAPASTHPLSSLGSGGGHYYRSVAEVGVQVADALNYAHGEGIIHRDIKPSNLLLDVEGRVWITDFGLAYQFDSHVRGEAALTHTGDIVGTVPYMAPERFRGWSDPRSDVYGLGITLYELLALRPAFHCGDQAELIRKVTYEDPPPLRKFDGRLPYDLETIVQKAIEKEPSRRYASAGEMAADLRRFLDDKPILARRVSGAEKTWRWCRRNPTVAGLLAAVVLLAFVGFLGIHSQWRKAEANAVQAVHNARQAERNLFEALVREVHALRLARQPGYRIQVEDRLQQAIALDASEPGRDLLRQEMVGCLGDPQGRPPTIWDDLQADVNSIAFHPRGELVALGLRDGKVLLRDTVTGADRACLELDKDPGGVQLAGFDDTGSTLLAAKGEKVYVCTYDGAWRPALAFAAGAPILRAVRSQSGKYLVVVCAHKVMLWDCATFSMSESFAFTGRVDCANISPDDRWLAVGYTAAPVSKPAKGTPTIKIYDRVKKKVLPLLHPGLHYVLDVAFSPDGRRLACACLQGVAVYDAPSFVPASITRGSMSYRIAFSPDSRRFVYASRQEDLVYVVDAESYQQIAALPHPSEPDYVVFSRDGKLMATGGRRSVRIWNLATPDEKLTFAGHSGGAPGIAFSRDGGRLATVGKDRTIRIWNSATAQEILKIANLPGLGQSVSFHPSGELLASSDFAAGTVHVWDAHTGKQLVLLDKHFDPRVHSVAFSPDGRYLAAGSVPKILRVWHVEVAPGPVVNLRPLEKGPPHTGVGHLCFSPDTRYLAWTTNGGDIRIWDLEHAAELPSPGRAFTRIQSLAFFPDGKRLVFLNRDRAIVVWDVRAGRAECTFPTIAEEDRSKVSYVAHVALSPDGRFLAANSVTARGVDIWDPTTGIKLLALPEDKGAVWCLDWSPDSNRLAVARADGAVACWDIPSVRHQLARLGLDW